MSVSFVAGQLPPVFFICLISFLWLRSFLHLNIKWSTVCSSSHGHIGLSVSPSLYKYDFMLPCPVSIVVNSGNIGIFCVSLFLTDGKKSFCKCPPSRIHPLLLPHLKSMVFFSCYDHLFRYLVIHNWSIFHSSFFCKPVHQLIPL